MKPDEIRELRDKLRLTQAEFAQQIGVSSITISRWERGSIVRCRLDCLD